MQIIHVLLFFHLVLFAETCVLFVSIPAFGHYGPLMQIAKKTLDMGETVMFASFDENGVKDDIEMQGINFCSLGAFPKLRSHTNHAMDNYYLRLSPPYELAKRAWKNVFAEASFNTYKALIQNSCCIPDVVVADHITIGGILFANDFKKPLIVNHVHSVSAPTDGLTLPKGFSGYGYPMSLKQIVVQSVLSLFGTYEFLPQQWPEMEKFRASLNITSSLTYSGDFEFYGTVFGLEYKRPLPDNYVLTGALMYTKPNLAYIPQLNGSYIYVSFGTVFIPSKEAMLALSKGFIAFLELNPSMKILWRVKPEYWDFIQKHERLELSAWVDQKHLLKANCIKAVVCHGGFNIMIESLYHAKPLVFLPIYWDQWDNTRRAVDAGVGIELQEPLEEEKIVLTLSQIIGEPFAKQALRMSVLLQNSGGVDLAYQVINSTKHLALYAN